MNRRARDVEIAPLGIRADQVVRILRFELVRIQLERFEIANAVVAGAGLEIVTKRQGAQRRISAGAAAIDHRSILIDIAALRQELRAINAIVDIDNAPGTVEPFAIRAAVAGAPAIIHVENSDATTGPILNREYEHRDRGRCR